MCSTYSKQMMHYQLYCGCDCLSLIEERSKVLGSKPSVTMQGTVIGKQRSSLAASSIMVEESTLSTALYILPEATCS